MIVEGIAIPMANAKIGDMSLTHMNVKEDTLILSKHTDESQSVDYKNVMGVLKEHWIDDENNLRFKWIVTNNDLKETLKELNDVSTLKYSVEYIPKPTSATTMDGELLHIALTNIPYYEEALTTKIDKIKEVVYRILKHQKKEYTLNEKAVTNCNKLISEGKVNKTDPWSYDRATDFPDDPSTDFLGVDSSVDPDSKGYWKFPVIKSGVLYKSGVRAAITRAAQNDHKNILEAAQNIYDKLKESDEMVDKNVDDDEMVEMDAINEKIRDIETKLTQIIETQDHIQKREQKKEDKQNIKLTKMAGLISKKTGVDEEELIKLSKTSLQKLIDLEPTGIFGVQKRVDDDIVETIKKEYGVDITKF